MIFYSKFGYNYNYKLLKKYIIFDIMNIDIFYDGVDIKNNSGEKINGFTTNISFLKTAGITDYENFIQDSLKYINNRPISFQLYDDNDVDIEKTAKKICSYGTNSSTKIIYNSNIFVKIPVIKTTGESNSNIIKKLHNEKLKINVTAIFTKSQVDSIKNCFNKENDVIVSIFAGRINDSGLDSTDVVMYARNVFSQYPNVKILWAACRTVYNIFEAERQGAHIVTVPGNVISRMSRIGDNPHDASIEQVKQFRKDGLDGNIKLN